MRQAVEPHGIKLEQGSGIAPILAKLKGMGQWYPD
jgi:hypothetical protein